MSVDILFDDKDEVRKKDKYCHFGYETWLYVSKFFSSPYKKQKRELNVLDSIQTLLESEPTDENINKCQELSKLHRMVENTRARRRLERWSLQVIKYYLVIVFIVVLLSYIKINDGYILYIPDTIMITILSTTTVNIIGLGLIVLRGHFLANEDVDKEDKNKQDK